MVEVSGGRMRRRMSGMGRMSEMGRMSRIKKRR